MYIIYLYVRCVCAVVIFRKRFYVVEARSFETAPIVLSAVDLLFLSMFDVKSFDIIFTCLKMNQTVKE